MLDTTKNDGALKTSSLELSKLELLSFSLGLNLDGQEVMYGINVLKVKEIMKKPVITCIPGQHEAIAGMINWRDNFINVINLAKLANLNTQNSESILIVIEANRSHYGILVHNVHNIVRIHWENVTSPPVIADSPLIVGITEISEENDNLKKLIMLLDFDAIFSKCYFGQDDGLQEKINIENKQALENKSIFFVDDSQFARKQIEYTLNELCIRNSSAKNGVDAWTQLCSLADIAEALGQPLSQILHGIITDLEMPEMDGYTLIQNIEHDLRFKNIPIFVYSSLSQDTQYKLNQKFNIKAYIHKFDPQELADTIASVVA